MRKINYLLTVLIIVVALPIVLYFIYVFSASFNHFRAKQRAKQFIYKEIFPEKNYSVKNGNEYGITLEVRAGERKTEAEFWFDSVYHLKRDFAFCLLSQGKEIWKDTCTIVGYNTKLKDNVLDYRLPIKTIAEGYGVFESNGILFLCQSFDFEDNFYPGYGINVAYPNRKILISTDKGRSWVFLDLASEKARQRYLGSTDALRKKIVQILPLSENKEYLKITFIPDRVVNPKMQSFNFKMKNGTFEIE